MIDCNPAGSYFGREETSVMNQKEAVFKAVTAVKKANTFEGPVSLTREERDQVSKLVAEYFQKGEATFAEGNRDGKELTSYVSGLISNWLRKDSRLNGDVKYQPKNPGTRTGGGDESVKAMRALLSSTSDPAARAEIQAEIEKRINQLKPKKEINTEALPAHLRKYANQKH